MNKSKGYKNKKTTYLPDKLNIRFEDFKEAHNKSDAEAIRDILAQYFELHDKKV